MFPYRVLEEAFTFRQSVELRSRRPRAGSSASFSANSRGKYLHRDLLVQLEGGPIKSAQSGQVYPKRKMFNNARRELLLTLAAAEKLLEKLKIEPFIWVCFFFSKEKWRILSEGCWLFLTR